MKRILVLVMTFAMLHLSVNLLAQIRKIPAAVTDAFKSKYPQAQSVEFKDKLTFFQVDFQLDGAAHEARYSIKGEWELTEKEISESNLPAAVAEGFSKSKYTVDWEVSSVAWVQHKEGHVEYRILVRKSAVEKKYLYFNKEGKLLRDSITL
ncbi:MAG: PepSY-like domain-containing protein [Chitinophagaceae bacterium]|nr:PepSY-like domain-containing protein [Chitinophagaceae bacterium]